MENFRENVDYQFLNPDEVKNLTKTETNVAVVTVKDSADYSQDAVRSPDNTARVNRVFHLLIRSNDRNFITECVNYAIAKHISGISRWQSDIIVID